jgi:hypothetical protein
MPSGWWWRTWSRGPRHPRVCRRVSYAAELRGGCAGGAVEGSRWQAARCHGTWRRAMRSHRIEASRASRPGRGGRRRRRMSRFPHPSSGQSLPLAMVSAWTLSAILSFRPAGAGTFFVLSSGGRASRFATCGGGAPLATGYGSAAPPAPRPSDLDPERTEPGLPLPGFLPPSTAPGAVPSSG